MIPMFMIPLSSYQRFFFVGAHDNLFIDNSFYQGKIEMSKNWKPIVLRKLASIKIFVMLIAYALFFEFTIMSIINKLTIDASIFVNIQLHKRFHHGKISAPLNLLHPSY